MSSRRELTRPTSSNVRTGAAARASVRPGTRTSNLRYQNAPSRTLDRAASPAESVASVATNATKRKEREYDFDTPGQETNINVVVRCRGRNDREVRENSAVVVQADGVKGKDVELKLGPNALSNKTYNFDRVFSAAADQTMVFDDVVKPILDEMLAGFNCTVFAYGQTGTGKTYTMSGDMTETLGLLSDGAGIIPRALHALFNKLEVEDTESCVKCSFIELYNEELRDLIAPDDGPKLKIFDDTSRRHATTVVQGMEERHIRTAGEGIKVLQDGSLKRQVAATKCNDLSSRSHTVFTVTAYVRKKGEDGNEDYVSAGKLNLVDLAGSENIQRSGAENKRAAEAGLINKSLLTLGRVINALVDKNQHIPYRESKLTRLLQDSLGGQTKTCIIATISPAKSNLEETISTLDYAFRAKNIRNKPQLNAMINKRMLLRDFATEIERLKSELITTRQRNGVYLSNESYEEMTAQSESRRIVMEEQAAKMETLEGNLKNKVQELFALTSSFMGLRKDHEGTKAELDETQGVLEQTEVVLHATRRSLAEETHLRKAHQETEEKLAEVGGELIATLQKTVHDVDGLRAKNKRKSDLQSINRSAWGTAQAEVSEVTSLVEQRVQSFQDKQRQNISGISERMNSFVTEELKKLSSTQSFLDEQLDSFAASRQELLEQKEKSKDEMDDVLEEIKVVRDAVKQEVGESLQAIAAAAERIAADVLSELDTFHQQLHSSYSSLGKEFKSIFEDLMAHITQQRSESDRLRQQLQGATDTIVEQNEGISAQMQQVLDEEREQAAQDRQNLLAQITTLIHAQAETQETRLAEKTARLQKSVLDSNASLQDNVTHYSEDMDALDAKQEQVLETMAKSRDAMRNKLRDDWSTAEKHSTTIQATTKSVHAETVRVVDEQLKDLDVQMEALDDFVTRARSENASHHEQHSESIRGLSSTVESSFDNIASHFKTTFDRVKDLGEEMETETEEMQQDLDPLTQQLSKPLTSLREDIESTTIQEYRPTGETPMKVQYQYPTDLPRTEAHEALLAELSDGATPTKAGSDGMVFPDVDNDTHRSPPARASTRMSTLSMISEMPPFNMSLREVNPNTTGSLGYDPSASMMSINENTAPLLFSKRTSTRHVQKGRKQSSMLPIEGRENVPPSLFSSSLGPRRKSPRLN
ncbi:kinesin motor domain-containing protein [Colletotrichum higginsianum]|uniref:Kinesin motor domain-containing protein n=1 Tax=Colletotrichum higginsianum (strain IMI 349063) TaxID=759273 RepID=H1W4J4_COLHI|nr:Kinesin-like protein [Colletotrichum higginsianum IMI 349063]OBR09951.1 Kinesin-like protein [Colletotrichum higginsianum IMI 349063]GJD03021.1 kinesin-like protein [Colletotrichum higginsianum]CCF47407.1 kinesin motor domain-containing protein [Colletotrichum higginsianum]